MVAGVVLGGWVGMQQKHPLGVLQVNVVRVVLEALGSLKW